MEETIKRKRGRPKGSKNKKKAGDNKPEKASVAPQTSVGKKRGRPSKAEMEARKASLPPAPTQEVNPPEPRPQRSKPQPVQQQDNPYAPLSIVPPDFVYNKGDRVKNISNNEVGIVLLHREHSRSVYVHWGGGYSHYLDVQNLVLIKPASKEDGW
jgi:hypothetical protein